MNFYFTADTHFGHQNIVRGCTKWEDKSPCRDFKTLKDHDRAVIDTINKTVAYDDILYHLGDWSMGGEDNIWRFRRAIVCRNVHFICGNHDHHIHRNKKLTTPTGLVHARDLFSSYHDLLEKELSGKYQMVMCHYPILHWHKQRRGSIHLYGHVHQELAYHTRAVCVSLDAHPGFRPFSLDDILKLIKAREQHAAVTNPTRPSDRDRTALRLYGGDAAL